MIINFALCGDVYLLFISYGILLWYLCYTCNQAMLHVTMSHKLFYALAISQALTREIYWMLSMSSGCNEPVSVYNHIAHSFPLKFFGCLPTALYLTTFSVTLHTFANLYWTVTKASPMTFKVFACGIAIVNVSVWVVMMLTLISQSQQFAEDMDSINIVTVMIAKMSLGFFLAAHSYGLYKQFPSSLKRLFEASIFCACCLCIKPTIIVVLVIQDNFFSGTMRFFSFLLSEILPMCVMVYVERTTHKLQLLDAAQDCFSKLNPTPSSPSLTATDYHNYNIAPAPALFRNRPPAIITKSGHLGRPRLQFHLPPSESVETTDGATSFEPSMYGSDPSIRGYKIDDCETIANNGHGSPTAKLLSSMARITHLPGASMMSLFDHDASGNIANKSPQSAVLNGELEDPTTPPRNDEESERETTGPGIGLQSDFEGYYHFSEESRFLSIRPNT
eukprot:gb/GEZN01006599.1/.p1 GENE.gb/GEZN01006599.1/~~gb/GEZN01006599.1/.p1  ORF type:complete len:447 (-),score=29.27 gb/GEZN01006599.1/:142-1482(-)